MSSKLIGNDLKKEFTLIKESHNNLSAQLERFLEYVSQHDNPISVEYHGLKEGMQRLKKLNEDMKKEMESLGMTVNARFVV